MAMYDFNLISQPYEGGKAPIIRSHGCIKDGWIRLNLDPSSLVNDDMHVRVTSEHPSNEPHLFISKIQDWSDPVIECGPLPFTDAVRIEVRQWIDLGWGDWSDSTSWMITTKPKLPRVSSEPENQSLVVILIPQPSKEIYSYKLVSNDQQFDFSLVGHRTRTFVCLVPKNKFIRQHSLKFRIIPMLKHNRQGIPLSDDGSVLPPPTKEGLWTADLRVDSFVIEYRRWMISNSSSQSSLNLTNYYYQLKSELMIWLKLQLNRTFSIGTCLNIFIRFCEITKRNGGLTDSMIINQRRILKSMIESGADVRRLDVQWLAAMALLRSLKGNQPSDEDLECLMKVYRKTVNISEDRSRTTRLISDGFGALILSEVLKQLKQSMTTETRSRQHILVYLLFFNLISISLSLIPRISDAVRSDFRTTKEEVLKQLKKVRMTWLIGKNGSANERRFQECRQLDQKWLGDRPFPFEDLRTIAVEKQRKRSRSEMNNEGRQPQNEEKEERPPLLRSKRSNSVMSTSGSASSGDAIGSRRPIEGFKSVFDSIIQDSHFPIVRSAHTILGIQPAAPHNGGNLGGIPQSRFPVSPSAAADQSLDNSADSTSAVESPVRSNSVATTLPLTPESSVGSGRGSQGLSTARVRNEEEDSDEEEESQSFIQIERGEFEELKREYEERTLKLFAVMRCLREKVRKELETEQPPIVDAALPALPPNQTASEDIRRSQWQMTIDERNMYRQDFRLADLDEKGRVDYLDACCRFDESNLEECELRSIWNLVNVDQKHSINIHQYCALRFIVARVESAKGAGIAAESVIPQVLPPCLRPESIANLG